MKDRPDAILRPAQAAYLDRMLPPRDALLGEMEALAAERQVPIADPEVGRLLGILARSIAARRVVEVGTAIGYGALWLARGAVDGRVTSIERDADRLATAREFLGRAGVLERVDLLAGDALELLPRIPAPIDLLYLDGDKATYRRCLDLALPRLRVGGLVVADNLLWQGKVAEPPDDEDATTRAIAAFNGYFLIHPQLQSVILPLGDGLGVATKTKPLVSELGGPF